MKVLFLNPAGGLGGAERSLLDLLASLRAFAPSTEVDVVLGAPGELVDRARELGANVRVLALPDELSQLGDSNMRPTSIRQWVSVAARGRTFAKYALQLRNVIREASPAIVHSNGIKMHLLSAALPSNNVPLVWHVRDFLGKRAVSAHAVRLMQRRVSLAITNSFAVREDLNRLAPRLHARVMYNGIDTDAFSPIGDIASLDVLAGVPELSSDGVRVGLIATYARWKGHDVFFDAARRVIARGGTFPVRFYVIGGPLYETGTAGQYGAAELRALAESYGLKDDMAFIPFQSRPENVLRSLDIVVHASTQPEPFGRTIVEAMACGCAVIVSRAGGAAELFTEGRDAVGVPSGDGVRMADAITRLVSDSSLRRTLGVAASRAAKSRFSRDRLGAELVGMYADLMGTTLPSATADRPYR